MARDGPLALLLRHPLAKGYANQLFMGRSPRKVDGLNYVGSWN